MGECKMLVHNNVWLSVFTQSWSLFPIWVCSFVQKTFSEIYERNTLFITILLCHSSMMHSFKFSRRISVRLHNWMIKIKMPSEDNIHVVNTVS